MVADDSLKILVTDAAANDYDLHQMDVKQAFTIPPLDSSDPHYMELPPGWFPKEVREKYVYRLDKSLYGLRRAAKYWADYLSSYLLSYGFTRSTADPCLFHYSDNSGAVLHLLFHVDDLLASNSRGTSIFNDF